MEKVELNDEQIEAKKAFKEFMESDDKFFLLEGYAGTGKTTCIKYFLDELELYGDEVLGTAPTNAATKILGDKLNVGLEDSKKRSFQTTYSAFGLRLKYKQDTQFVDYSKWSYLNYPTKVVIIDEISMISKKMTDFLKHVSTADAKLKFILMGDPLQLPPVEDNIEKLGNRRSFAFDALVQRKFTLTKVMRQEEGNPILQLNSSIRKVLLNEEPSITFPEQKEDQFVVLNRKDFIKELQSLFNKEDYDVTQNKVLAWTNKAVNSVNAFARKALYPDQHADHPFIKGEIVKTKSLISSPRIDSKMQVANDLIKLPVNTDLEIKKVENTKVYFDKVDYVLKDSLRKKLEECFPMEAYKLLLSHNGVQFYVIALGNNKQKAKLNKFLKILSDYIRATKKNYLWNLFWAFKEKFTDLRHTYAQTVHTSQGDTFETVYVASNDILNMPSREDALKCFYVASSRPSKKLIVSDFKI